MNISNAYQGVSLDTVFYIIDSGGDGRLIGCIALESTPVMASYVWYVLVFVVLATLVGLAVVYVLASWLNPWTGTKNILIWSSNYGYDSNAIRLITPGISDFLRYLQFAFFVGSLNLDFPGYFRPVLATASWSCLLFHFNFVSTNSEAFGDNLYIDDGYYGMSKMARVVQLVNDRDIWPSFIIWMLILSGIILLLSAIVYLLTSKWHRPVLGSLNLGDGIRIEWRRGFLFLGGIVVRLFFILFPLPLLACSFYQMLIVRHSPVVSDVFALILIIIWIGSALWFTHKMHLMSKRMINFSEDLPTLLVYGPLFNIFKDSHIMYFAVELIIVFFQGLTFGAVQRSGIAQITLLAIIEIVRFVTLVYYKPYENGTSMTMVSSLFSATRIIEIFLLIPFIKQLNTDSTVRGWVGYVILIIHAVILLLFIVHIAQVLFELFARLGGAGKDEEAKPVSEGSLMTDRFNSGGVTGYGLKQMQITGDDNLVSDKGGLIPQSPTDNGYRRPRSQYGINSAGLTAMKPNNALVRDSVFEEVFASPTEMSPSLAKHSTPSSANYYRRPRRRPSSHDWGVDRPISEVQTEGPGAASTLPVPAPTTRTDYAVREADLYITKRATNSLYGDDIVGDGDDDYSRRDSESVNPLVYKDRESSSSSPIKEKLDSKQALLGESGGDSIPNRTGLYGSVKGIMDRVGGRLRVGMVHPSQRKSEELPEGKGFEVMNRQPIKLYKPVTGTTLATASAIVGKDRGLKSNFGSETGGTTKPSLPTTEAKDENDEDPGFIFKLPSSVGAGGPSQLRVVTDPINTKQAVPKLISPLYSSKGNASDSTGQNSANSSNTTLGPIKNGAAAINSTSVGGIRSVSRQSQISETGSSIYQSIYEDEDEDEDVSSPRSVNTALGESTTQLRPSRNLI